MKLLDKVMDVYDSLGRKAQYSVDRFKRSYVEAEHEIVEGALENLLCLSDLWQGVKGMGYGWLGKAALPAAAVFYLASPGMAEAIKPAGNEIGLGKRKVVAVAPEKYSHAAPAAVQGSGSGDGDGDTNDDPLLTGSTSILLKGSAVDSTLQKTIEDIKSLIKNQQNPASFLDYFISNYGVDEKGAYVKIANRWDERLEKGRSSEDANMPATYNDIGTVIQALLHINELVDDDGSRIMKADDFRAATRDYVDNGLIPINKKAPKGLKIGDKVYIHLFGYQEADAAAGNVLDQAFKKLAGLRTAYIGRLISDPTGEYWDAAREAFNTVRNARKGLRLLLKQVEDEVGNVHRENAGLVSRLEGYKNLADQLKGASEEQRKQHEAALLKTVSDYESRLAKVSSSIDSIRMVAQDYSQQIARAGKDVDRLSARIESLEKELQKTSAEGDSLRAVAAQRSDVMRMLKGEMEAYKSQAQSLGNALSEVSGNFRELQGDYARLQKEYDETASALGSARKEISGLKGDLDKERALHAENIGFHVGAGYVYPNGVTAEFAFSMSPKSRNKLGLDAMLIFGKTNVSNVEPYQTSQDPITGIVSRTGLDKETEVTELDAYLSWLRYQGDLRDALWGIGAGANVVWESREDIRTNELTLNGKQVGSQDGVTRGNAESHRKIHPAVMAYAGKRFGKNNGWGVKAGAGCAFDPDAKLRAMISLQHYIRSRN